MAVAQVLLVAAVLLLHSSAKPASSESCTRLTPDQLNCSSSGLSSVPQHIPDSVTELDLTNNLLDSVTLNRPHYHLRNVWLGNNSITHLSLCVERNTGRSYITGRQLLHMRTWRRSGCVPWAPSLQLLSVEWNQLEQLPEGLEGSSSLQVLQLSFNRISTLRPRQLSQLRQLKELHLQHNLITSLHPQMFNDLARLQVLDLSFNMLTSLHPQMYLSLHNLGANVRLAGNKWKCDCSMRSVRRRMLYDSSRGVHTWSVVCASPSSLSGRDLLQLEDDELNCVTTQSGFDRHQDVTVFSGSEILLSCSTQDSMGWTPSDQASVNQPEAGVFITDVAERDTGLYVCVSEAQEVVSVFNLQISKVGGAQRRARSLPESGQQIIPQTGQERNGTVTQSDLALAVCLSILFTFLVAFILGVLARPCIDVLWKRVTKKKSATVTNTVSTVQHGEYDNEAYCNIDEAQIAGGHRERRVTFSTDVREDANVQYYDTVARDQDSVNDSVFEYDTPEGVRQRTRDSDSDSQSSQEGHKRDGRDLSGATHEFEHIPDPVEADKRRHSSSSSSSDSSLSDKENREKQIRPKSSQLVEESVQQRANISTVSGDLPDVSTKSTHEIPGFSSEPFAGWSPHTDQFEEQFEFSDSARSISPRSSSVIGSFNDSKPVHKQKRGDTSSSSSFLSENEVTHYTVNSDNEEDAFRPSPGFNHSEPAMRKTHSSSSSSSDSDEEGHKVKQAIDKGVSSSLVTAELDNREKVKPIPRSRKSVPSLTDSTQGKGQQTGAPSSSSSSDSEADSKYLNVQNKKGDTVTSKLQLESARTEKSPYSSSSSSSDSEDEAARYIKNQATGQTQTTKLPLGTYPTENQAPPTQWPPLDLEQTTKVKRRLDIKVKSSASSSSDSEKKTIGSLKKPGTVNLAIQKSQTSVSTLHSSSSSSSDSEDESNKPIKNLQQGQLQITSVQLQGSQTVGHNLESGWPVLNLQNLPRVKRRLDIKAPKPTSESSSSSSDSEDEMRVPIKTPGIIGVTSTATPKSPPVPKHTSDSSSSSDSEDEATKQIKTQNKGQIQAAILPLQKSPNAGNVPQTQWPLLDLERTTSVKKRLDIKVKSQTSETSSSSDSENDRTGSLRGPGTADLAIQKSQTSVSTLHSSSSSSSDSEDDSNKTIKNLQQGELQITSVQLQGSQTVGHNLESGWPVLNLQNLPRVKRRLDIKAPKPASDSSSSSDSEDETRLSVRRPAAVVGTKLAITTVPKPNSVTSSSSDSEDEETKQIKTQNKGQINMEIFPLQTSPNAGRVPQTQWPLLDLEHTTSVKKRLDIKVKSHETDTSSSSDSEDEIAGSLKRPGTVNLAIQKSQTSVSTLHSSSSSSSDSEDESKPIKNLQQGHLQITSVQLQGSQTVGHNLESGWPVLNLQNLPRVKRRLDIKAPKPTSDSSSSSDSEDEMRVPIKTPGIIGVTSTVTPIGPKHTIDTSSSSDSEDEETKQIKTQNSGQIQTEILPLQKSPTAGHVQQTQWPLLDLGRTTSVKKRLDIKVKSQTSDTSSSSDSENDRIGSLRRPGTTNLAIQKSQTSVSTLHSSSSSSSDSEDESKPIKNLQQGELQITSVQLQGSQTVGHNLESGWPVLNLQNLPRVKRRLDIKAPKPASESSSSSDSENEARTSVKRPGLAVGSKLPITTVPKPHSVTSSSSDSEDEETKQIKTQNKGQINMEIFPLQTSPNAGRVPQTQWPLLDLERTTSVKKRLDIKVKSQDTHTSSSSDSEDEIAGSLKRPGTVNLAIQKSQTSVSTLHSSSSSSSDSEDESKPIKNLQQGQLQITSVQLQGSQTVGHNLESGWPVLNLQNLPRVKRRLDIKAPKPSSDSSSSSDSENERRVSIKRPGIAGVTNTATSKSPSGPKHTSDSSSSSDSEDESNKPIKNLQQGQLQITSVQLQGSQTVGHNLESGWPVLNLQNLPRVKRRLDIKAPKPASDSSSSSDSENERGVSIKRPGIVGVTNTPSPKSPPVPKHISDSSSSSDSEDEATKQIKTQNKGQIQTAILPLQKSPNAGNVQQTQWPLLNPGHTTSVKRRLDIKVKSQASDTSSSSDSEEDTTASLRRPGTADLTIQGTQTRVSKSHSASSSSSDSEDEANKPMQKHQQDHVFPTRPSLKESITVGRIPSKQWPLLDLENTTSIKRRLDIKVQSPRSDTSSSSDSEDEARTNDPQWKVERERSYVGITSRHPGSVSPDLNVTAPTFRPHLLNVKTPGPQQTTSSSSSSESEDENKKNTKLRLETNTIPVITERELIESPQSPVIDIPLSPKTDPNFKLQKYNSIPDGNVTTTPEINPELESRWATMNLGISRFRKRLEITSRAQEPPKVPSSPPPVSSSSSSSSESENEGESGRTRQRRREVGLQEIKYTRSSTKSETTRVTVSPSMKGPNESFDAVDFIGRQERPLQREASSSSDSGSDTVDHRVPDLSLGVPRIKRRLNVMAPSPQPGSSSSSSSDSEGTEYSAKQSRPVIKMPQNNRDTDTLITYKRSIFQTTSPTSSSPPLTSRSLYYTRQTYSEMEHESRSRSLGSSSTSAGAKKIQSRSFDDLLKKIVSPTKRTTELPPELKWTGVGRQMPDMPVSSPGRRLDVGFTAAPAEPGHPPPSSSSSSSSSSSESDDETKQDRTKSDVTLEHEDSSFSAVTASTRTFDTVDNSSISTNQISKNVSEERRERRGLSALKIMSSEIQQWDINTENLENRTSLLDDPNVETSFYYQKSEGYTKPMATDSLTKVHLPAAAIDERRAADMSYGIPSYRRYRVASVDPPQETPPPIPATPPPSDEAMGFTWKSRPNSWKQRSEGTGYYVQQSRYTVETDPSSLMSKNLEDFLDTSKNPITEV